MIIKRFALIIIALITFYSCNQNKNILHTDALIIVNSDYIRYEEIFENELTGLYYQIDTLVCKDTCKQVLITKALDIRNHSIEFVKSIDGLISNMNSLYPVEIPNFNFFYKKDWDNLIRDNLLIDNQFDSKSAYGLKNSLESFHGHLIYVNKKNIHSNQLDDFLQLSIQTYNYLYDESWENTLILNKTKLDLITVLNKIKFEAKMSEFMTIKCLFEKI